MRAEDPLLKPTQWPWTHRRPGAPTGWRLWRLRIADGELLPLAMPAPPWRPGVNEATCQRTYSTCKDPPTIACLCGFWAMRRREDMDRYRAECRWSALPTGGPEVVVWGTVALWGTVVTCEYGWRASHAAVTAIAAQPGITDCLVERGFPVVPPEEIC